MSPGSSDPQYSASHGQEATRDAKERIERIKRLLLEDAPDTGVLVHDLNELDTAVAALGNEVLAAEAKELRDAVNARFPV